MAKISILTLPIASLLQANWTINCVQFSFSREARTIIFRHFSNEVANSPDFRKKNFVILVVLFFYDV